MALLEPGLVAKAPWIQPQPARRREKNVRKFLGPSMQDRAVNLLDFSKCSTSFAIEREYRDKREDREEKDEREEREEREREKKERRKEEKKRKTREKREKKRRKEKKNSSA